MHGAIKGMLETLDPHTVFMPPEVFKEMKIDTSGEFGGLGIEIARKGDGIVVVAAIDDTPAARAGMRPGDQILAIDDESTQGMDLAWALQKMRGPAGKQVLLTIMREGFSAPRELAIIRDHIRIVSVEGALYGGIGYVKVKNFQDRTDAVPAQGAGPAARAQRRQGAARAGAGPAQQPGRAAGSGGGDQRSLPAGQPAPSSPRAGRNGANATEERSKDRDTEKPTTRWWCW